MSWVCRFAGHVWEYGWQGNGNRDRRECTRCHIVMRIRRQPLAAMPSSAEAQK